MTESCAGGWAGLQAADRQACRTLWAQVWSSSVTECLSGSCSSLDVMFWCTLCRKLLAPEDAQTHQHQPRRPTPPPAHSPYCSPSSLQSGLWSG